MATYFVDGAVGDDANAGTSEGAGNAWATIDKAMNTVAAGDKVWVKASATYNELATIDTAGTISSPIVFEGYTSTTGDGGKVTIDAQNTRANCIADSITGALHYVFKNFICQNATGHGVAINQFSHQTLWDNCEFNDNGSNGFFGGNGHTWVQCVATNNGVDGLEGFTTCTVLGCKIFGNQQGVIITYGTVAHSVFYNNSTDAIHFRGSSGFARTVIGCTIDGNGKVTNNGIEFGTAWMGNQAAINNIIYDCSVGIVGINQGERLVGRHNLLFNNTTDYTNFDTTEGEVTSDPKFTDEANQDYTLQSDSPAIDAGFDASLVTGDTQGHDIGAHATTAASGGAAVVGPNKRAGKQ